MYPQPAQEYFFKKRKQLFKKLLGQNREMGIAFLLHLLFNIE
jgi:hypothetical protein